MLISLLLGAKAYAASSNIANLSPESSNSVELNIKNDNQLKLNMTKPVKLINGQIFKTKEDLMKEYFQVQKKMDVEDIKLLWEATIDKNPVIKFALKKLATPANQRRVHSSIMAKTVSALISGATILPGIFGSDPLTSSAVSAGGVVANKLISAKEMPKNLPLTDTELIHLARLIEDLQDKIIRNYYEYKSGLEALKVARQEVIKQNKAYSDAISTNDSLVLMTTSVLYDNALKNEMETKAQVKIHRLELMRLVGNETLDKLKLGKIAAIDNINKPANTNTKPAIVDKNAPKDYSDESIIELSSEIGSELKDDQKNMLSDLKILWDSAVERSETIRFAILKLSNPNGEVEKTSSVKRILSPLASVSSLVGMGMSSNPVAATSAMFGGGFLNSLLSSEDSELNSHLSKVTDADLVLLAQETDNLQQKLINLYCNYTSSLAELNFIDQTVANRKKYSDDIQLKSPQLQSIADVFYKEALDNQHQARQKVLGARVELEQFVGDKALAALDKNVMQRLSMQ